MKIKELEMPNIEFKILYGIYEDGRIIRLSDNKELTMQFDRKYPYYTLRVIKNGIIKQQHFTTHRMLAYNFIDGYSSELQVNHKDGNKLNFNLSNLEWVTAKFNINHAYDNGLNKKRITSSPPKGDKSVHATITEKTVIQICKLIVEGIKPRYIVSQLNISKYIISDIKCKKTWKEVSDKYFKVEYPIINGKPKFTIKPI